MQTPKHKTTPNVERRFLTERVEVRASGTSAERKITGYAAKFAPERSSDLGGWVEEIHPNAFRDTLKTADIRVLFNHDPNFVCGRTKSGTAKIFTDSQGLRYEVTPPDAEWAYALVVSMRRGDIDQSSYAFRCIRDDWKTDADGTIVRVILEAELFDCSVVTYPATESTTAQARAISTRSAPSQMQDAIRRAKFTPEHRYRKILSHVTSTKWAMHPDKLAVIVQLLNDRAAGKEPTEREIREALSQQHGDTPSSNGVAVIPVYGSIAQRMGMFDDFSGGTSCESITRALRAALADETVNTIVLDIDSPGGTVTGVPELAAEILAARDQKPIIAVSNGMAASAAYWIASAASKIVCMPSGEVGSIGVYTTHQDISGALQQQGVKLTLIQAGKYKTEGNSYGPLSDEAKADIQDGVDKFYQMFTQAVATGRGVSLEKVLSDFGQGRMLMANDALAAGMIDEIATLDQVLAGLSSGDVSQRSADYIAADDSDDTDDTDECSCACQSCINGFCSECDEDCDDSNCSGCPMQDQSRLDALRVRKLFSMRMAS